MTDYDWVAWHDEYEDPKSNLALRLAIVQSHVRAALDRAEPGPFRVVSVCAGQGRDLLPVIAQHPRRDDVVAHLIEIEPENAKIARVTAADLGLAGVTVSERDAGVTDAYVGVDPADLLLMCGIFLHLSKRDVARTIQHSPSLCAPNGTVIWTRDRHPPDFTPTVRTWFRRAGFVEDAFETPPDVWLTVGVWRAPGVTPVLRPGVRLFTFGSAHKESPARLVQRSLRRRASRCWRKVARRPRG